MGIESNEYSVSIPKELESLKDQKYFSETYEKLVKWYGDDFNGSELKIIKGIWEKAYNEYNKDINKSKSIVIANRIDKGIFEFRYTDFVNLDKNVIRTIPDANKQRKFREVAINLKKELGNLSSNEIKTIENEFLSAKNNGKLPDLTTISNLLLEGRKQNEITEYSENSNSSLRQLRTTIENNPATIPSNRVGFSEFHSHPVAPSGNPDVDLFRSMNDNHWPSDDKLQRMENVQLLPYFQDMERELFESGDYDWNQLGNEKYVKYYFRKFAKDIEFFVDDLDDTGKKQMYEIVERDLQLVALGDNFPPSKLTQNVLTELGVSDINNGNKWNIFKKLNLRLKSTNSIINSVNDASDDEMLRVIDDPKFSEAINLMREKGIDESAVIETVYNQTKLLDKKAKGMELTEEEEIFLLEAEGFKNLFIEIVRLHEIKKIQKENESKSVDLNILQPQYEVVESNIKSLSPDSVVRNNQAIHDYVYRVDGAEDIDFDGDIDAEYRKVLFGKLVEAHKDDPDFMESIKYLDSYGNIDYKKVEDNHIDVDSLRNNLKTIDDMIKDLAEKEFRDKEKINRIDDVCTKKCIMSTCFRALSSYFDSTNNNGENFAAAFEIGDINENISFDEETGIIHMKGKIGGENLIGLYYDTKNGTLSFDNFIGFDSNVGYVIGKNNGQKEKINIKVPTMDEMERQTDKLDKDLIYKLSINTPMYIKTLSKCLEESLWLGCFQGFIGTEMDVNKQFVKEFNEKNILKQEIFRSVYTRYYNQDSIDKIVNDKLVISKGNENQQFKLIKLISDSIDNCSNSNELLRFRNLMVEFDGLISENSIFIRRDKLLTTLFANNLRDDNDIHDQSAQIMENENSELVVDRNRVLSYENPKQDKSTDELNYYTFLDLISENHGVNRIINLDVFDAAITTIRTDGVELLDEKNGVLWSNYESKVREGELDEIVPITMTPYSNDSLADNTDADRELEERLNDIG